MPWLLKRFIKKQQKKYYNKNYYNKEHNHNYNKKKTNTKKQLSSDDIGEYVDYKEIKNDKNYKEKK